MFAHIKLANVNADKFLATCRLSPLVFEAYLFALTMYAFCRSVMRNLGKRSILYVFVRDGTWAFIIVFGTSSYDYSRPAGTNSLAPVRLVGIVMMLTITLMYKLSTDTRIAIGYLCVSRDLPSLPSR